MTKKTVAVVSSDAVLSSLLEHILNSTYTVSAFRNIESVIDYIYNSVPDLIIIDVNEQDQMTLRVLSSLKGDPIFHQLPVLLVLGDTQSIPRWDVLFVEDYIRKKDLEQEGRSRVDLSIVRSERSVEVNPLTKLPGNISINRQLQDRLDGGNTFALAYADLDHFKPFNDYYGFTRGDEVIRITGRLILNIVKNKQSQESFVGHIGGDDFVFVVDVGLVEEISQEIIDAFDRIIPTLYDPDERAKGYIEAKDRQGQIRHFPLVSISIGITTNVNRPFTHYGEITELASEMKSLAKRKEASCYSIDKRRGIPRR